MPTPSAREMLTVWERGSQQSGARRAMLLLEAMYPADSWEVLAQLPIGERDARLLALRESIFGSRFESLMTCPGCKETWELTFDILDVKRGDQSTAYGRLEAEGYEVRYRLPNSEDLLALSASDELEATSHLLLTRCIGEIRYEGMEFSVSQLPARIVDQVVARMAEADPQAEVHVNLTCPACGDAWQALFDIVSFFWSELDQWAKRLLSEVHVLASTYGWSENDILTLSPQRRRMYLEMVGG